MALKYNKSVWIFICFRASIKKLWLRKHFYKVLSLQSQDIQTLYISCLKINISSKSDPPDPPHLHDCSYSYLLEECTQAAGRAAEKFKLPGSADYKVQDFLGKCAVSRQYDRHFYFAKPHVSN